MTDDPRKSDELPEDAPTIDGSPDAHSAPTEAMESMPGALASGVPDRVGQYRIKRAIASGGMGTVYEALQERPRRTVAVKVIRAGIASASALRRFEYEAQLLARLRHPGIAQIYEAGTHREGDATIPFFAMEYIVAAKPVTEYVREKGLGTRQRVKLFIQVCEAVHHGHQKGIIHRDLKPSNILVDSSGQVKIIDFGVARSTDSDMAVTTLQTDVGALLGTLQYMSPEQCAADPHDIDTRSDVYTLGVILFEILTGQLPYEVKGTVLHEATRIIQEQSPARPSTIDRALRGDLETIALMALEKDRDRRYQSTSALTADLRRYLNNEAISARPPSMTYQLKVFARRNKGFFAAVATIFAVLLAGATISTTLYFGAEAARNEASARAAELEQVAQFQEEQLTGVDIPLMGIRMRQGLLDQVRSVALRTGDGDGAARARQLGLDLAGIDFTGLSSALLDESVFAPALETIGRQFQSQPLVRARLLQALATTLRDLGLLQQARPPQEQALSVRREELGEAHPSTLRSIHEMGLLLLQEGDLEEAERNMRLAVDGHGSLSTEMGPPAFRAINDLGIVIASRGRLEEAEPLFLEALDGARRTGGETHDATLEAYNNVGWVLVALGKAEEAEPYYRKSLEGNRTVHGDNHPNTLTALQNLSGWLRRTGKVEEGLRLHREALEGMQQALGHQNPRTLQILHNYGHALAASGNDEEAATTFSVSVEGTRATLGEDHRLSVKMAGCYGELLNRTGRPEEAEPWVRAKYEGARTLYGEKHEYTLVAVNNLAFSLNKLGRFREAANLTRASEPAARELWADKKTESLGNFLAKIGEAQIGLGQYVEAEVVLLEAAERMTEGFGAEHPLTMNGVKQLIALYEARESATPGEGFAAKAAAWKAKLPSP